MLENRILKWDHSWHKEQLRCPVWTKQRQQKVTGTKAGNLHQLCCDLVGYKRSLNFILCLLESHWKTLILRVVTLEYINFNAISITRLVFKAVWIDITFLKTLVSRPLYIKKYSALWRIFAYVGLNILI